jgi:acetylornithine deacetylase/succinyl-diaminopimelate desuccinylase-like protein
MTRAIATLAATGPVAVARRHVEAADARTLERQRELSAIAAPTGGESRRGARVAELLGAAGLAVTTDGAGNVRGVLPHADGGDSRPVVLSAHLDTVFGPEVDVSVRGNGKRLEGPGIADNARGLAALVAVAEALAAAGLAPRRPIWFVATVGEEGAGNLRGVRYFLADGIAPPRPAAFIALDGAGLARVVHRAIGSKRYRVTYRGPGGHSWTAFGVANPASAVGQAIAALPKPPTHDAPRTTLSVVGLGGGTGLNTIPGEAWLDLDLRSESPDALERLDRDVQAALVQAAALESGCRTAGGPLAIHPQVLGDRPSGVTPATHALVRAALAATRSLGTEPELAAASTDANVPIALGIPAIALGAGGRAGDTHLTTEWYENDGGALGIVRALLVTLAMAEVA